MKLLRRMIEGIGAIINGLRSLIKKYPDDNDIKNVLQDAQHLSDDIYYLDEKNRNKRGN